MAYPNTAVPSPRGNWFYNTLVKPFTATAKNRDVMVFPNQESMQCRALMHYLQLYKKNLCEIYIFDPQKVKEEILQIFNSLHYVNYCIGDGQNPNTSKCVKLLEVGNLIMYEGEYLLQYQLWEGVCEI